MLLNTASKVMAGGVPAVAVYAGDVKVWPPAAVQPLPGHMFSCPPDPAGVVLSGITFTRPVATCDMAAFAASDHTLLHMAGWVDGVQRTMRLTVEYTVPAGREFWGTPQPLEGGRAAGSATLVSGQSGSVLHPGTYTQVYDVKVTSRAPDRIAIPTFIPSRHDVLIGSMDVEFVS